MAKKYHFIIRSPTRGGVRKERGQYKREFKIKLRLLLVNRGGGGPFDPNLSP